jgi:hypothetical protein
LARGHQWQAGGLGHEQFPTFDKFGSLFFAKNGNRNDFKRAAAAILV